MFAKRRIRAHSGAKDKERPARKCRLDFFGQKFFRWTATGFPRIRTEKIRKWERRAARKWWVDWYRRNVCRWTPAEFDWTVQEKECDSRTVRILFQRDGWSDIAVFQRCAFRADNRCPVCAACRLLRNNAGLTAASLVDCQFFANIVIFATDTSDVFFQRESLQSIQRSATTLSSFGDPLQTSDRTTKQSKPTALKPSTALQQTFFVTSTGPITTTTTTAITTTTTTTAMTTTTTRPIPTTIMCTSYLNMEFERLTSPH